MEKLTQTRLKKLLHYDPDTGIFTWLVVDSKRVKAGDIAGYINSKGYRRIKVDYRGHNASRLAWLYMKGYFPEHEVDHEDRIKCNNKWKNLRHVTHSCNMKNVDIKSNNKSGVVGVYWNRRDQRWQASIKTAGKSKHLGSHIDFIEAVKARWKAEVEHGYPDCNSTSSAFNYLQNFNHAFKI